MKILIVEDEHKLSDSIVTYLKSEKYLCEQAFDYNETLEKVRGYDYDCVLLDLMLPRMDGFTVCRSLREAGSAIPVIMLTAREEESDKVMGLEIGADDYITKPFSMRELLARVKANIRRFSLPTRPAEDRREDGAVLHTAFSREERNGWLYVTLRAECEEQIGMEVPLITE